jgi:hypothetical protein
MIKYSGNDMAYIQRSTGYQGRCAFYWDPSEQLSRELAAFNRTAILDASLRIVDGTWELNNKIKKRHSRCIHLIQLNSSPWHCSRCLNNGGRAINVYRDALDPLLEEYTKHCLNPNFRRPSRAPSPTQQQLHQVFTNLTHEMARKYPHMPRESFEKVVEGAKMLTVIFLGENNRHIGKHVAGFAGAYQERVIQPYYDEYCRPLRYRT